MSPVLHSVKRSCQRSAATVHLDMSHGLNVVAALYKTAPSLGMMATLFGFVNSFRSISGSMYPDLRDIAIYFGEALIPTLSGIATSVMALSCYNYLQEQLEAFDLEMKGAAVLVVNSLATGRVTTLGSDAALQSPLSHIPNPATAP